MVNQPTPDRDARQGMSEEQERVRALSAVMREQAARVQAARDGEVRRQKRARYRRGALLVMWVGIAYIWRGAPSWLTVPTPADQPIGVEAKALRLNVFLQTQQIEAYRLNRGRLPYVLEEAGPPFSGMAYRRADSRSYELSGTSDRVQVRYDSDIAPLDFVGEAADLIDNGPTLGGAVV